MNPWGLTATEERIVAAVCKYQSYKAVALRLGITRDAAKDGLRRAKHKIGGNYTKKARKGRCTLNTIAACIIWDRWANQDQRLAA